MRALFLASAPRIHEDSAFLLGRVAHAANELEIQRVDQQQQEFTPPQHSVDIVVDRSLSRQPAYMHGLHAWGERTNTPISNPPLASLASYDKRTYPRNYPDAVPETHVVGSLENFLEIYETLGRDVVIKDPFGAFGKEVERINNEGDLPVVERLLRNPTGELIAQPYLPGLARGDKRVIVQQTPGGDYESLAWMRRVPGEGQWKANLSLGGRAEICVLTDQDREVIAYVAPRTGLHAFGIDLGEDAGNTYLIETNAYHGGHVNLGAQRLGDAYIELIRHLAK